MNSNCGAEYVQKEVKLPTNIEGFDFLEKFAAFDGDADRLIYFMRTADGVAAKVIDGDKQFALLSVYIADLCSKLMLPPDL